jgi:hypothetical protein
MSQKTDDRVWVLWDWELHLEDGRIARDPNTILKLVHAEGRRVSASRTGK